MEELLARIDDRRAELTPTDRRIADALLHDPRSAALATVAEVARAAGTSGASVVRFADRLGYRGWAGLQAAARASLGADLRPATERIREPAPGDLLTATAEREAENLRRTFAAVDRASFERAAALLADRRRAVAVVAGDAEHGIGNSLTAALDLLRPDVAQVTGSPVAVARQLARLGSGDVVVALDLRRYERWVVEATARAAAGGALVVAVTDSAVSPLADLAEVAFAVAAEGAGPFDSHVGMLALVDALVSEVAHRLRRTATARLDQVEAAWRGHAVLS